MTTKKDPTIISVEEANRLYGFRMVLRSGDDDLAGNPITGAQGPAPQTVLDWNLGIEEDVARAVSAAGQRAFFHGVQYALTALRLRKTNEPGVLCAKIRNDQGTWVRFLAVDEFPTALEWPSEIDESPDGYDAFEAAEDLADAANAARRRDVDERAAAGRYFPLTESIGVPTSTRWWPAAGWSEERYRK